MFCKNKHSKAIGTMIYPNQGKLFILTNLLKTIKVYEKSALNMSKLLKQSTSVLLRKLHLTNKFNSKVFFSLEDFSLSKCKYFIAGSLEQIFLQSFY